MVFGFRQLKQSLNFSTQNLQGNSFKGKKLTGANFSYCDIRGADFTGANLSNADFSYAKAGLNNSWVGISFLLSLVLGFLAGAVAVFISSFLCSQNFNELIAGTVTLIGCIAFLIISVKKGFANAFITVIGILGAIGTLAGFCCIAFNQVKIGYITLSTATNICLSIMTVASIAVFLSFLIIVTSTKVVNSSLISAFITAILIPLVSRGKIAINITHKGWFGIIITVGIAVLIIILCEL
ncbi:rfrA pentapeptide repeat-containing protein [Calothrix parasitica NIES-267]|uniref:RfrA pentapeptide repeat-containing protein n=1 Tax=Calothrix parasitica NIES-267 TaxID=1973488 RepID=A0A1Z4LRP7_9CYAN|nr:rfrA pentapeptide repeat-containing protein [Calothrix parasitica NIES-267]